MAGVYVLIEMEFSYRNNEKVSLQSQAFKAAYFYAFIFTTSCFVAKKRKTQQIPCTQEI